MEVVWEDVFVCDFDSDSFVTVVIVCVDECVLD